MNQTKPQGPVMVLGGGIAGIQAALTLSQAGYGVHLVERASTLGGMMPKLHRIYPLCSCCKLDPRIAACEEDPNINVITDTRIKDISGKPGAFTILLETGEQEETMEAGAVILAAGIETFEPTKYDAYAYGHLPNVVTSVEYEQIQKPLGPGGGVIKRPSDGRVPEKVAWLQCVGSRDINRCDAPYCSSVCCMHALKEAVQTKEFNEEIEATLFYMDMRTHGKGFEDYLNQAVSRGVRLVRSRIHTVESSPDSDDLVLIYADESGEIHREIYDLVVLSVGLRPSAEAVELARKIGVAIKEDLYLETQPFKPVSTNIPGIFVCGGISGPHDIGQSIVQASAAVSEVAALLQPKIFKASEGYPQPKDEEGKEPKIFFAYHLCPQMAPELAEQIEENARNTPKVAHVAKIEGNMVGTLAETLRKTSTNRLVFASCTPVIHHTLLEESLQRAGLNPYLYETVDLRAVDSQNAFEALGDRIRMGVARAALITPPPLKQVQVVKRALVVGGGVTGLESALAIAREGYPVTLVEKERDLGGHGRHVMKTWQGHDAQSHLRDLIASVKGHGNITVLTETTVKKNRGVPGHFVTTLEQAGKPVEVPHGVTVLAPGGDPIKPEEYLYGRHKGVYEWSELSAKMLEDPSAFEKAGSAVFIQCVGSREPHRPHCSNLCCTFAARTAVDLKTRNPDMNVYILYREMRTFGERENLYREARQKGVVFIRYDLEHKPVVETLGDSDKLRVRVVDPVLGKPVALDADLISLQTAIVGTQDGSLSEIFKISLDSNGFFAESPQKLRPLDATSDGIYLAGLALYPKDTGESITQAKGAAARALEFLSRDTVQFGGVVAEVRPEKCAVCCTCVRTCPFQVPFIDHELGAAHIDPGLCQGCGMCVAECPAKAIVMAACSDDMLLAAPSVLLGRS
jgi:heterodisulfide reductase subunit A